MAKEVDSKVSVSVGGGKERELSGASVSVSFEFGPDARREFIAAFKESLYTWQVFAGGNLELKGMLIVAYLIGVREHYSYYGIETMREFNTMFEDVLNVPDWVPTEEWC